MHINPALSFLAVLIAFFAWAIVEVNIWDRSRRALLTPEERDAEDQEARHDPW